MTAVNDVDAPDSWEEVDDGRVERVWGRAVAADSDPPRPSGRIAIETRSAEFRGRIGGPGAPTSGGVTILKRPGAVDRAPSGGETRTRPVRSLQERQREYEAARLRILGQARSPDDAEQTAPILKLKTDNGRAARLREFADDPAERPTTAPARPGPANRPGINGVGPLRATGGPSGPGELPTRR